MITESSVVGLFYSRGRGWTWHDPHSRTKWCSVSDILGDLIPMIGSKPVYVRVVLPKFGGWKDNPDQTLDGEDIVWLIGQNLQWVVVRESE